MKLCSNKYYLFWENISQNITTIEALVHQLIEHLPSLADTIKLGKMTLSIPDNQHESGVFAHPQGYHEKPVTEQFTSKACGTVLITCFPQKDYSWSDDELEDIHFLSQSIFILYEKVRLASQVQASMITDSLTGAFNTAGLLQHAALLKARQLLHHYTCACLNLKNFKFINQRFGTQIGDTVLRKYCYHVKDILLEDELFARLGGDNFIALIRNEHIKDFLDNITCIPIRVELADSVNTIDIIPNIGVCPITEQDSVNDIMNRSTLTVMLAKNSVHHNILWFRESMLEKEFHDKELASAFSSAITNKEFVVYYQPKVQLEQQTLCGCEALVRWQRGDALLPPTEFIYILEKEGSICLLDFYVFEKVCQDLRSWLDQGIEPVQVSVNFSKLHLHNRMLSKDILSIMEKYRIDPKYIEIELTESSGYEDFDALDNFINTMNKHGISTAIDDFGTGYSSLNLLKNLKIKVIKLDKSFLHTSLGSNKADEVVIKTIIQMAQDLDMQVVCEGVETKEQANFLKKLHCHIVQGFLFDKPLPHDEYQKRLLPHRTY